MQGETERRHDTDKTEQEKALFDGAVAEALTGYAKDGGDWELGKGAFDEALSRGERVDDALYIALDSIRENAEESPADAARRFWGAFPVDQAVGKALTGYAKDGGDWELGKWTFSEAMNKEPFIDMALSEALDSAKEGAQITKEMAAANFWRVMHPSYAESVEQAMAADLDDGVTLGRLIHRPEWKEHLAGTYEGEKDGQALIVKQGIEEELGHEREVLAAIDHPGIPRLVNYAERQEALAGLSRLTMERLPGRSMQDILEVDERWRSKSMDSEAAVAITTGLAECFKAVSDAGYVYRDLSPAHVIVEQDEDGYKVGLIDLDASERKGDDGIARIEDSAVQRGTWETMAPEEFGQDCQVDERSSVYSLSCMLSQMLTGESSFHVPFELSDDVETRRRFTEFLHERSPSVQIEGKLGEVLRTGLDPDPAKRYQTIDAFQEALAATA
jgi:serine/threonine protein kinase